MAKIKKISFANLCVIERSLNMIRLEFYWVVCATKCHKNKGYAIHYYKTLFAKKFLNCLL